MKYNHLETSKLWFVTEENACLVLSLQIAGLKLFLIAVVDGKYDRWNNCVLHFRIGIRLFEAGHASMMCLQIH